MSVSLGFVELLLLGFIAIASVLLYLLRNRSYRVCFAMLVCATLAALITPADVVSMVLLTIVFGGVFLFGAWYRVPWNTPVSH